MMRHKKIVVAVMALLICLLGGKIVAQIESRGHVIPEQQTVRTPIMVAQAQQVEEVVATSSDARPRSISIPSINLKREIIDVGITTAGNLDVPPNYTQVGWYKYGTLPGQIGSAVLDGHVDNGSTIPGPFKKLREVEVGDEIYVTAADGTTQKFVVTQSQVYPTTQFPGNQVFHDKSGALLKIVTCHGTFVPSLDTYDQRLIVTAKLVK
jgi:sortase (surface protein transpeptidase)